MTAVRVKHLPTGIVVTCQTERSLQQNKELALEILQAKLLEKKELEERERLEKEKKEQIKSGERSEKIRTYNFPQNRITDHRIKKNWQNLEDVLDGNLEKIIKALEFVIKSEGFDKLECYGERIENRENCQITYSAYGQQAPLEIKENFDPDRSKRMKMREKLLNLLPEFSIRLGGKSSIDITQKGIDKAYGIRKIIEYLNVIPENILFIGDELNEGGNDYPVYEIGIDCVKTSGPKETNEIINKIINGDFVGLNIIHNRNT